AYQPTLLAGQRKRLDPNPLGATWRLRLGAYRVFYDVDTMEHLVKVMRVGHKPAETLYLRGKPFPMRVD
ncbi:MAG: type II toxin-antitoxin system RelE family toxin, partial [Chloroflexota bacterium]